MNSIYNTSDAANENFKEDLQVTKCLASPSGFTNTVRLVRMVPQDLILSQFLLIKPLKLLITEKKKKKQNNNIKTTGRTFKMIVVRFVAERGMEDLYLSLC